MDFGQFKGQMDKQTIPRWLAQLLTYILPETEIIASLLLIMPKTRLIGFYVAFILMLLFTGYAGLVLANYFGRVPCSCGGILKTLSWKTHFLFNLFFLILTVAGITIIYRERRQAGN